MDAQNGTVCWRYSLRGSVRSSIAIADGLVFAQDVHGYLYAIQAETGTLVWEKDLNIGVLPPLNDGLVAVSDIVYAGTGKSLCALKAATGELIWKNGAWSRGGRMRGNTFSWT
jgi:outer membrane protein assembly factor BamB